MASNNTKEKEQFRELCQVFMVIALQRNYVGPQRDRQMKLFLEGAEAFMCLTNPTNTFIDCFKNVNTFDELIEIAYSADDKMKALLILAGK